VPVLAVIAWVVVGVEIVATVVAVSRAGVRRQAAASWYREAQGRFEQEVKGRQDEMQARLDAAGKRLQQLHTERGQVLQRIQVAERVTGRHVGELDTLEQREAALASEVNGAKLDKSLVAEGADELRAKVKELEAERTRLTEDFKVRYGDMKAELRRLVDGGNPERIRLFYFGRRHTPLAPAAAFFAADAYYAQRKTRSAQPLYEEVAAQYPGSAYAAVAKARLTNLKERIPYSAHNVMGYHPYKIDKELDDGVW